VTKIIPYKKFTTGLTYREVAAIMWDYQEDSANWLKGSVKTTKGPDGKKKWGRRRLILGKWHEIKLEMYAHYLAAVRGEEVTLEPFDFGPGEAPVIDFDGPVPF